MRIGLLLGARSNAGDHLIGKRVKELFRHVLPDAELLPFKRWLPLDDRLDEVNACDCIVLAGGPAFQPKIYPSIYPLVKDLDSIRVPIVAFGLGWKGWPGDRSTVKKYRFTQDSRPLLDRLAGQEIPVSCRDSMTVQALARAGVKNSVMTGDPAWYDRRSLMKPFQPPQEVRTLAFSTPAALCYIDQTMKSIQSLRSLFPDCRIQAVFHHGWKEGDGLGPEQARRFAEMRDRLVDSEVPCINIAGSVEKLEAVYSQSDLHVGYRLHSHLFCLSRRTPSFLINEDGRGIGASEALGLQGINAWQRTRIRGLLGAVGRISVVGPKTSLHRKQVRVNPSVPEELADLLEKEIAQGYPRLKAAVGQIDRTYEEKMRPFLMKIGRVTSRPHEEAPA